MESTDQKGMHLVSRSTGIGGGYIGDYSFGVNQELCSEYGDLVARHER